MKAFRLVFSIYLLAALMSCNKNEITDPAVVEAPELKAANCTPSVINYNVRDTLEIPAFFYPGCMPEPIMVTLYDVHSKGHINVAASCRFNDKSTMTVHVAGIGSLYGYIYDCTIEVSHHYIGTLTGQGATIIREITDGEFVNLTTGETFTLNQEIHQVINGNGEIVQETVVFLPCE